MTNHVHEIAKYIALILISSAPVTFDVFAEVNKKQAAPVALNAAKKPSETARKILADKHQQIDVEAEQALSDTQSALHALSKNDTQKALVILQAVLGKLDVVLAKNPALALVPADVEVDIVEFEGGAKEIKKEIKSADDLLDNGKIQEARQVLSGLVSEMRVTTTNIPLGSFPGAIKNAVSLIDAGKTKEAATLLYEVLALLEKTTEVIPLPLLNAEGLLAEATKFEHKEDMSKEKSRAEVLKLADQARDQLKLAELLGYGDKKAYKTLYTAIDEIKETVHSESSAATWEKIKHSFSELKQRIMSVAK